MYSIRYFHQTKVLSRSWIGLRTSQFESHSLLHSAPVQSIRAAAYALCLMFASFVFPVLASEGSSRESFVRVEAAQRWTIGNGQVERTIEFVPNFGLLTRHLLDVHHREDLFAQTSRPALAAEFSFECNGRMFAGARAAGIPDFDFLSVTNEQEPNGKVLVVRLRARNTPLEVAVFYRVYDGQAAVQKQLSIRNLGPKAMRISRLSVETIAPSLGPENEIVLNAGYGTTPREIFYTGRSEDGAVLISNAVSGEGIALLNGVPGYMKRTEVAGWDFPDRLRIGMMYDTDLMPFERSVAPGETFTSADVSLVLFRSGNGFDDPRWRLPSYTSQILMRRGEPKARQSPWIYNTWEPFERRIDQATTRQLVDVAGKMGFDIFTIDDGWQLEYGENAVNRQAFPDGLEPIRAAVEGRHMRLGLWVPLAAIGVSTTAYRQHPEWAAFDISGKPKGTMTAAGSKAVMCLATPYRDLAAERVNTLIEQYHLGYVKLDLTTIFNAYGESPGCWAKGHFHATWAESLGRIYEGIQYITQKVYARHPDVLLDLTFELWGQKHLIDAGLLTTGDLDWMSNVDDRTAESAGPIQARTLLYQRAMGMPVDAMLIGNLHAELPSREEAFATAIGSSPLLLGDLRKLTSEDQEWYREKIGWFKELRRKTQINESFFPLGRWNQPSSGDWDGFARLSRDGAGVIALFKNKSQANSADVTLPLLPAGRFKIRSVITGKDIGVVTSDEMARGVAVSFPEGKAVEIVEMNTIR